MRKLMSLDVFCNKDGSYSKQGDEELKKELKKTNISGSFSVSEHNGERNVEYNDILTYSYKLFNAINSVKEWDTVKSEVSLQEKFPRRKSNTIKPNNIFKKNSNSIFSYKNKPIFMQLMIKDLSISGIGNIYTKPVTSFSIRNNGDNFEVVKERVSGAKWKTFIALNTIEVDSLINGYQKVDFVITPLNDVFYVTLNTTNDKNTFENNKWIRRVGSEKINFQYWSEFFREMGCYTNTAVDTRSIYITNGSSQVRLSDHHSEGQFKIQQTKEYGIEFIMDISFKDIDSTYILFMKMISFLGLKEKFKKYNSKNVEKMKTNTEKIKSILPQ